MTDFQKELVEEVAACYGDPLRFCQLAFPWGEKGTPLEKHRIDDWQVDYLNTLGEKIRDRAFDGVNAVDPIQMAVASGHGIGKSALTSMLTLFFMSTRPNCKMYITAGSFSQLQTKTFAEIQKWHNMCITKDWFSMSISNMNLSMKHKAFPSQWFAVGLSPDPHRSDAFAGAHNVSSSTVFLMDEASTIDEKIFQVIRGALTDGEPFQLLFGNGVRATGGFFNAFHKDKDIWTLKHIDSRESRITNKKYYKEWIDRVGEDSDEARVRIRGLFPKASDTQFIPGYAVQRAMNDPVPDYLEDEPLVCGIDLSRGGGDDTFLVFRRGRDGRSDKTYRIPKEKTKNSMTTVAIIAKVLDDHKPDACFADGGGPGGAIIDRLNQMGYNVTEVQFGAKATDDKHYANKGVEMWSYMRAWLVNGGGVLKKNSELETQLTQREIKQHDKLGREQMESKPDMKERGIPSPDWADALALTFASPVPPRDRFAEDYERFNGRKPVDSYCPLDNERVEY